MIDPHEVFEVTRVEHHLLSTCPCACCTAERLRRQLRTSATIDSDFHPSRTMQLTPETAFLLGFISSRSPSGSRARDLTLQQIAK